MRVWRQNKLDLRELALYRFLGYRQRELGGVDVETVTLDHVAYDITLSHSGAIHAWRHLYQVSFVLWAREVERNAIITC